MSMYKLMFHSTMVLRFGVNTDKEALEIVENFDGRVLNCKGQELDTRNGTLIKEMKNGKDVIIKKGQS